MEWLDRAYRQNDPGLLVEIIGEPLFHTKIDDPRFEAFLHKMKLPEEWPGQTIAADK